MATVPDVPRMVIRWTVAGLRGKPHDPPPEHDLLGPLRTVLEGDFEPLEFGPEKIIAARGSEPQLPSIVMVCAWPSKLMTTSIGIIFIDQDAHRARGQAPAPDITMTRVNCAYNSDGLHCKTNP